MHTINSGNDIIGKSNGLHLFAQLNTFIEQISMVRSVFRYNTEWIQLQKKQQNGKSLSVYSVVCRVPIPPQFIYLSKSVFSLFSSSIGNRLYCCQA